MTRGGNEDEPHIPTFVSVGHCLSGSLESGTRARISPYSNRSSYFTGYRYSYSYPPITNRHHCRYQHANTSADGNGYPITHCHTAPFYPRTYHLLVASRSDSV